jgi:hypothetical protein
MDRFVTAELQAPNGAEEKNPQNRTEGRQRVIPKQRRAAHWLLDHEGHETSQHPNQDASLGAACVGHTLAALGIETTGKSAALRNCTPPRTRGAPANALSLEWSP